MNCTRSINVKIWDRTKNIIEGDPYAISANNESCVVVESWEGCVGWKGEEGLVREGSCSGNMATDGVVIKVMVHEGGVGWCKVHEGGGVGSGGGGDIVGMESMSEKGKTA